MRLRSCHLLCSSSLIFLVAACAGQVGTTTAPTAESAPLAVDLGGSSRIWRIAGAPGEGEGYDSIQPSHASTDGMVHQATAPAAGASAPAVDHKAMGHGAVSQVPMDHSKMDHGSAPARSDVPIAGPKDAQAGHVGSTGTVNSVD